MHGLSAALASDGLINLSNLNDQIFTVDFDEQSLGTGIWNRNDQFRGKTAPSLTLIVRNISNMTADRIYSFSVNITNPTSYQSLPSIFIEHSGTHYEIQSVVAQKTQVPLLNEQGLVVGSARTLE